MTRADLVFGLLDNSGAIGDQAVAAKYRDLTIPWSRYGYRGEILEGASVDEILSRASSEEYAYCFIQSYGYVISERWRTGPEGSRDFHAALEDLVHEREFFVSGHIIGDEGSWYGLRATGLVVDLRWYRRLGAPGFEPTRASLSLPGVHVERTADGIRCLSPTKEASDGVPTHAGWRFVEASLREGLPVTDSTEALADFVHDLEPEQPGPTAQMKGLLGDKLAHLDPGGVALAPGQRAFLQTVERQSSNAKRGVFLWNIEAYDDVETPPDSFGGPVSVLYSVSAGFKPNRILETHGMSEDTRVVFFDYSEKALAVRKLMLEEWDGKDFPRFCRVIFDAFPSPDTFYQLWTGAKPLDIEWVKIEQAWERELARWGGPDAFASSWIRARGLQYDFVRCDILTEPRRLLDEMSSAPGSVIWWSNAFFTMYSNWLRSLDERALAYRAWAEALSARAPEIHIYGSDDTNANVNGVRASDYFQIFREANTTPLVPEGVYRTEIRM